MTEKLLIGWSSPPHCHGFCAQKAQEGDDHDYHHLDSVLRNGLCQDQEGDGEPPLYLPICLTRNYTLQLFHNRLGKDGKDKFVALQGDTAGSCKPPVDFKTKVLLLPGQARPGEAKTELLF